MTATLVGTPDPEPTPPPKWTTSTLTTNSGTYYSTGTITMWMFPSAAPPQAHR